MHGDEAVGVKVGEGDRFGKNLGSSILGSTSVSFKVPSAVCCTCNNKQNYFFSSLFIFVDTFPLPAGA